MQKAKNTKNILNHYNKRPEKVPKRLDDFVDKLVERLLDGLNDNTYKKKVNLFF